MRINVLYQFREVRPLKSGTKGDGLLVSYRLLAQLEGIFCEPASAASVAGLIKVARRKRFTSEQIIVCTLTGHGLKDPDTAVNQGQKPVKIDPDIRQFQKAIEE